MVGASISGITFVSVPGMSPIILFRWLMLN